MVLATGRISRAPSKAVLDQHILGLCTGSASLLTELDIQSATVSACIYTSHSLDAFNTDCSNIPLVKIGSHVSRHNINIADAEGDLRQSFSIPLHLYGCGLFLNIHFVSA